MSPSQKAVFLAGEGDRYFERNMNKKQGQPLQFHVFKDFIVPGQKVLEIGCSGGFNEPVFRALGAHYTGIDPSQRAISEATKAYPQSKFLTGTSDHIQFEDQFFDFIFFGFCLYLVDRSHLTRTVGEVDRVLKNRGYVAILDSETKYPTKRAYRHNENITTYKMDYSTLFLAFPQYAACFKSVFNIEESSYAFVEDIQNRVSMNILYKNLEQGYETYSEK